MRKEVVVLGVRPAVSFVRSVIAAIAGLAALLAVPASAASPVVVELFTSQGCSDCPPANANLRAIADRPDVLALSFSVTYWDRLGWKDTFGKPEFTQRQYAYAEGFHRNEVYTPQMVVNGHVDLVGNVKADIEKTIAQEGPPKGPEIALTSNTVTVAASSKPAKAAIVWLVRYDPRTVNVPVGRGENVGVVLPHRNVVRALTQLGSWNGNAANYTLPPAPDGLSTAVLVQEPGGIILSAAKVSAAQ